MVSRAHRHVHVLRTAKEGASVSIVLTTEVILILSLVTLLGNYAFRIQNPSLFIDCNKENSGKLILEKYKKVTSNFNTYHN